MEIKIFKALARGFFRNPQPLIRVSTFGSVILDRYDTSSHILITALKLRIHVERN